MANQVNVPVEQVKAFFDKLTENKNLLYVIVPFNIGDVICNACFS